MRSMMSHSLLAIMTTCACPDHFPQIGRCTRKPKAEASFWTTKEVDLSQDLRHWEHTLTSEERHFVTPSSPYSLPRMTSFSTISHSASCLDTASRGRAFHGFQIAI
ncbi:hypothetical protein HPP92_024428 [Vanilla planifolia]|uniref:Secreted protein n=1 Tax=Vanilla planifolia TaxID=51239 RepID=A0A835PQE5_VANPL|nr:hypothetical protein HPP92_024740 [Vanilla planifolia]KAG0456640.1 hypothetical protein HPP92_024428 [Vanilla planifolia]